MAERDRGRLPGPATSILENAVRFKPHFVLPCTTPQPAAVPGLTGTKRNRHWLAQCTYGGLFLWRLEERVLERSTGVRPGKPGSWPGLPVEAERRINYMIKLLVELPLIGKFTIIIVWHRKGRR